MYRNNLILMKIIELSVHVKSYLWPKEEQNIANLFGYKTYKQEEAMFRSITLNTLFGCSRTFVARIKKNGTYIIDDSYKLWICMLILLILVLSFDVVLLVFKQIMTNTRTQISTRFYFSTLWFNAKGYHELHLLKILFELIMW